MPDRGKVAIRALAFSADGNELLTGHAGHSLVVWNTDDWREEALLVGHQGAIASLAMPTGSADKIAVSSSEDQSLKIWQLGQAKPAGDRFTGHGGWVSGIALSKSEKRLVSASWDGTLKVWDTESRNELATLEGHDGRVLAVDLSRDGSQAVSGGADGTVRLWDVEAGKEVAKLTGHVRDVTAICYLRGGRRVISGGVDGTVRLWDVAAGKELRRFNSPVGAIRTLATGPDDSKIIVIGESGNVAVIADLPSGKPLVRLAGHLGGTLCAAFSPDGMTVATGGRDRTLRLWDVTTGNEIRALRGTYGLRPRGLLFARWKPTFLGKL